MTIHRAVDLAWFGPWWKAKANDRGRGPHLVGALAARGGDLGGALAPKLPPPSTGRYPSDVSGADVPDKGCSETILHGFYGLFGLSRLVCDDVQV
jgi:hypothetical protein